MITMTKKSNRITIIGGYGGMGKFFANIFTREGFDVQITGPNEVIGKKVAKELDIQYIKDNIRAVEDSDIVMVSVPVNVTLDVIKEIAPHVKPRAVLMDVTSIKEKPCKAMEKYAKKDVEVIGTHPIFSHRVGNLEGQVFVLTPIRGKKWFQWFKKFLEKHKVRVLETTPTQHDEVMAIVQGLTHFTYISVGKTLEKLDFDIKESRKFSSPIYELMLDMIGRIIGQNPELYASIQMENPRIPEIHNAFLETAEELSSSVREKDKKRFIEIMTQAARHFDDVDRAMGRSDKAIFSLISELDLLKNSIGKELCLKHIYSGNVHIGVVESVTPEKVVLNDSGHIFELKLSNIQILSDEEKIKHEIKARGTVMRDFSIIFDEGVNEKFISELLERYDERIIQVNPRDIYFGPQIKKGKKSVCFGVELLNRGVKKTEKGINKFFESIGGESR